MLASKPRKRKVLAWLPALLVIGGSIVTAAGISLVPATTAATSSEAVNISATVGSTIAVSSACGTAAPGPGSLAIGTTFSAASDEQISADCPVVFSTNYTGESELIADDSDANTGGTKFLCRNAGCVDADNFEHKAAAGMGVLGDDEAGFALEAAAGTNACWDSGCAAAAWNDDADNAVALGDASFYQVSDAGSKACGATGATGGVTCTFVLGAQSDATLQNAGAYTGQVTFTANTI